MWRSPSGRAISIAHQRRRERCGVPADLTFRTHTELAWELIETLHTRRALPFEWVIGDEQFGNNPLLLDQIAAAKLCYLMEVRHDTLVWRERPATLVPPPSGAALRSSETRTAAPSCSNAHDTTAAGYEPSAAIMCALR